MIASDHVHGDPGGPGCRDGLCRFRAGRINNSDYRVDGQMVSSGTQFVAV